MNSGRCVIISLLHCVDLKQSSLNARLDGLGNIRIQQQLVEVKYEEGS